MKILVDISHPAHVHLFKNFIWEMEKRGHEIKITAKEKEINFYLLDKYGFEYDKVGKSKKSLIEKAINYFSSSKKIEKIAKRFKPDIFLATGSPYVGRASNSCSKDYIAFYDTEHAEMIYKLFEPYADAICTPSCFLKNIGPKQIKYNGYHELAYLHPNRFKPSFESLRDVCLNKDDIFFILRFVSWTASHDRGHKGLNKKGKINLVKNLEKYGKVFITSESKMPKELEKYKLKIPPEKIHDFLYFAQMYLGDGGTMATESAVLGTPAIRISTVAKYLGNFLELRDKYKLLYFYDSLQESLKKINEILENDSKKQWKLRKEKMLKDKIDVTAFMVWFAENYPESKNIMKETPEYQMKFK